MNILFFGDSITDCNHAFTSDLLGNGYVKAIQHSLPNSQLFNFGIDGFTLQRAIKRWEKESQQLTPGVVSMLVGINDLSAAMEFSMTPAQSNAFCSSFLSVYEAFIHSVLACKNTNLLILEPFLFDYPDYLRNWFPTLHRMQMGLKTLAKHYAIPFVPLQDILLNASDFGSSALTLDGIHPTYQGHEIIAKQWLSVFQSLHIF